MGNLIASLDFMLRVALIPRGVINHDDDKPSCIQSERYPIRGGLHKLCSVFEGIQGPFILSLACKSVVLNHVYIHSFRNIIKVSRGWGHLITWNGPIMGHLNSFLASGEGNLNKNFPKLQLPGGLPGGDVEVSI